MIIDYLNKERLKELGVRVNEEHGRVFVGGNEDFEGKIFRNFPTITTDGTNFTNCVFEDTQAVEFSQGTITNCMFRNVSQVSGHYTDFKNCKFIECCSQGPLLTIDSAGSVEGCLFETITALGEDGYVIYSVYGKKKDVKEIKNCKFIDCKAESEDGLFTYCAYYTRFLSCKIKEIENIDANSCDFGGGVPTMIGNFESEEI